MFDFFDLQLFADGGSATGGADGATGVSAAPTANGDTAQSATEQNDGYAQFKEKYKAQYDAEVQGIVKDRVKKSSAKVNELTKQMADIQPILDAAAKKYGVDVTDTQALINAFADDDDNYTEEAYERGMTVEQVKTLKKIERENATLKAAEEERQRQAVFAYWDRQSEELKQIYPGFDIQTEMQDENFLRLMNAGVPIRTAYEVAHHDELVAGAMQFTAAKATEKVTNAVRANKARPSENGLSNNSSAVTYTDIRSLSKEQMEDYKRRARAGEKIDFRH